MSVRTEMRPMTEAERTLALQRRANMPKPGKLVATTLAAVAGCGCAAPAFAAAVGSAAGALGVKGGGEIFPQAMASFFVLGATWLVVEAWREHVRTREVRQQIEADVAAGLVEVLSVEAGQILWGTIDDEDADDDDPENSWILAALGGGEHIFLVGPHAASLFVAERSICRRFELVRLPAARLTLSVRPWGDPIPVEPSEWDPPQAEDGEIVRLSEAS